MNRDNKWTIFSESISFKGMTDNNKAVLNYIAQHHHSSGCVLTFRQIGVYAGITKTSAKNNVKKLERLGVLSTKKEYPVHNCRLPLRFNINLGWTQEQGASNEQR